MKPPTSSGSKKWSRARRRCGWLRKTFALLCIVCCAGGCSTSYVVTGSPGKGDYSRGDAGVELSGKDAVIVLHNGGKFKAERIQATADSIGWIDPFSGMLHHAATADVQTIRTRNHWRGALDGTGIGALGGVLILGVIAALGEGKEFEGLNDAISAAPGVMLASVFLGAAVGALFGHTYVYEFQPDSPSGTREEVSDSVKRGK